MAKQFLEKYAIAHNAKRKRMYQSDPNYRNKVLKQARVRDVPDEDVRAELLARANNIEDFAQERQITVRDTGEERTMMTMTLEEAANAFNRQKFVLARWRSENKFPIPNIYILGSYKSQKIYVYLASEIAAALRVMADHFSETPYYHPAHVETREQLFYAMQQARQQEGLQ